MAIAYGLHELGVIRLPMPQTYWQVPPHWSKYGPTAQALMYGVVLGADIFTFVPYATFYLLLPLEASSSIQRGAILGVVYGLARTIPTLSGVMVSYARHDNTAPLTNRISHARPFFHAANGFALAVVGEILAGSLWMT